MFWLILVCFVLLNFNIHEGMNSYFEENKRPYGSYYWFPSVWFWRPVRLSFLWFDCFYTLLVYINLLWVKVWTTISRKTKNLMVATVDFLMSCSEILYYLHCFTLICFVLVWFIIFKFKKWEKWRWYNSHVARVIKFIKPESSMVIARGQRMKEMESWFNGHIVCFSGWKGSGNFLHSSAYQACT